MARGDEAQLPLALRQRVDEVVGVGAGDAEYGIDAVRNQRIGDHLSGGHDAHDWRPLSAR